MTLAPGARLGPYEIVTPLGAGGSGEARRAQESVVRHWTRMDRPTLLIHLRTTLIPDDELLEKARRLSGLEETTATVHAGLEALVARESARRLAALGSSEPGARTVRRRRPALPARVRP